jgi:selenocysteine lyase/cysteine desulfurase
MATDEITTGLDAVYINVDNIDGFGRTPFGKAMRKHFQFSSSYRNLNHGMSLRYRSMDPLKPRAPTLAGSYGTYPNSVAATFQTFQAYHEERPDVFIRYRVPPLIQSSLRCFADILNVPWQDLAMMPNACTGVDTVLRSLFATSNRKNPERDTIIYFSSTYGACQNIVSQIVESHPEVNAHCITLTFPLSDAALIASLRNTLQELGKRVGLVIIDTIVAMPGVRTPFEKLVTVCREFEGVLTLIDGAHGVGHIKIDLGSLKPDFFISNSHK